LKDGGNPDVVVVGAGAAGLFASAAAARAGAKVFLLEKTSRIGTKILISGGGKCNIAHAGPLEDVIRAFPQNEAVFLRPSCYGMSNERIMESFTSHGLELYERPDGRVFPTHGDARDVLNILVREVLDRGVKICLRTCVTDILASEGKIEGVKVAVESEPVRIGGARPGGSGAAGFGAKALLGQVLQTYAGAGENWTGPEKIRCRRLVVACGGSSYPNSGTTGDGWKWARALGHTVVRPRAALAPIYLTTPLTDLSGLAVRGCRLIARNSGKKVAESRGDLLFTHQGISGPATLQISRQVAVEMEVGQVRLELDFAPDLSVEALIEELAASADKTAIQHLATIAPARLADLVATAVVEGGRLAISKMGRKSRIRFAELLKGWPIGEVRTVPLEKGEVTAGGISLLEVDSKTMRSSVVRGLYLAGEVLDVAGPVGGYNLQAAFATGNQAGETAARDALADAE
jgi:predicted flavoprotein YhiN